jgi:hypothetical protein
LNSRRAMALPMKNTTAPMPTMSAQNSTMVRENT